MTGVTEADCRRSDLLEFNADKRNLHGATTWSELIKVAAMLGRCCGDVAAVDATGDTADVSSGNQELRPGWRHDPVPTRLTGDSQTRAEVLSRHDAAMERSMPTYIDPTSGFSVFSAGFLAARGYCCESGCRHCPYIV